jgi:hypothetical protein
MALAAIPLYFLTETVAELTVTVLELPAIEEDHKQEVIAAGTEEMERSDNLQKYGCEDPTVIPGLVSCPNE